MELTQYFNPVNFSKFKKGAHEFNQHLLGFEIERNTNGLKGSDSFDVAIVGVPIDNQSLEGNIKLKAPDEIREELFQLSNFNRDLIIVDFGNIKCGKSKKENILVLRDISEYLVELNVVVLIIGGSQDFTVGLCDAFKNEKYLSLSVVDAVLDVKKGVESFNSSNFLTRIFKDHPNLFQFNLLGYQRHLIPQGFFDKTIGVNQHIRLGELRDKFVEVEPVMRNTDILSFDLCAIKYSEISGNRQKNPNGLKSEEACQLARYAGLSERLKIFGLFETIENDQEGIATRLTAEIIWYFLDGVSDRKREWNQTVNDKVVYKVAINELDSPIVFYHDPATSRWWIEINSTEGEKKIVACSEYEYHRASNNEIPELWLNYIQKMDELLK